MYNLVYRQGFILMVTWLLMGCEQSQNSPLIDEFHTQMSVQEARLLLPASLRNWKIRIDEYPTYYVVVVDHYQSLGISGKLSLSFADGKLEMTCFSTPQMSKYIVQLEQIKGLKLDDNLPEIGGNLSAELKPNTRVFIFPNSDKICWRDTSSDTRYE